METPFRRNNMKVKIPYFHPRPTEYVIAPVKFIVVLLSAREGCIYG